MSLTPVTSRSRRLAGPGMVLGASLLLVGAGFLLGRASASHSTTVHVAARACPVATVAPQPAIAIDALPSISWASSVRGFSSQYNTTTWSAQQVLGAPDVFPQHGDLVKAWASLGADDRDEWIEVGFAQPQRISLVEIYETFNPGAITRVELVTASRERLDAPPGHAESTVHPAYGQGPHAQRFVIELGCTQEPIVAVRVHLASRAVPGWNELDAIGVAPCAEQ